MEMVGTECYMIRKFLASVHFRAETGLWRSTVVCKKKANLHLSVLFTSSGRISTTTSCLEADKDML